MSPMPKVPGPGVQNGDCEKGNLLYAADFNCTVNERTIIDLFNVNVQRRPGSIAVAFEGSRLSYKELDVYSTQLANYLVEKGVVRGALVPVCINRGIEIIVAILAIMKAGAAYVPIDPELPVERISHILQDVSAPVVIAGAFEEEILRRAETNIKAPVHILNLLQEKRAIERKSKDIETIACPGDIAYVIYTSGSTGKPKGVKIKHSSIIDYVFGLDGKIAINECRSFALVSTISADLGKTVIFSSLAFGGALHLFAKETVNSVQKINSYFDNNAIDCLKIVPSHWQALCEDDKLLLPIKKLIFGGEALPAELVNQIKISGTGCMVVNHYGPTETTIGKLLHIVDMLNTYHGTVPLGKPFGNTRVYILTEDRALSEPGVPGELYIEGDGVADGYLNNDKLTAERFIKNPFNENGALMYKTGDLVKYLPDGNIAFLGRTDDQVKIRGYRVELGEIENVLRESGFVKQAVVLAQGQMGSKKIIAYIVPKGLFYKEKIINYLKGQLPAYMMPFACIQLASLPLTENGKVDRKSLVAMSENYKADDNFAEPETRLEKLTAEIWMNLLGYDKIGTNSNFFELGGDSLAAIKLMARLEKLTGVQLPLTILFQFPTLRELAANIENRDSQNKWECLVPIRPGGSKIPVYIVHGVGGHVIVLNHILKYLDTEQPVYGLQPKGIGGKSEILYTIEQMAAFYIKEILEQNPEGPYALAGFSFGGIIAFEMMQQLTAMGKQVKALILFDSYLKDFYHGTPGFITMIKKLQYALNKLAYTPVLIFKNPSVKIAFEIKHLKERLVKRYRRIKWLIHGTKNKKSHMYYIYKIQDSLKKAQKKYMPVQHAGVTIDLFRAEKRTFYYHDYEYLGWHTCAAGWLEIHDMPGEHEKIFMPPDNQVFAETLQKCLDRDSANAKATTLTAAGIPYGGSVFHDSTASAEIVNG